MKQSDVPICQDSDDFELLDNIQYPCSTQYMIYNALLHRYQLTPYYRRTEQLWHIASNASI